MRSNRELSTRPKSSALTRWFIIVDHAKKRKSLARPRAQVSTGTDPDLLRKDIHLTKNVVNVLSGLAMKAHVEDGVGIPKQVHYADEFKLCVYGLLLKASRIEGWLRWT